MLGFVTSTYKISDHTIRKNKVDSSEYGQKDIKRLVGFINVGDEENNEVDVKHPFF